MDGATTARFAPGQHPDLPPPVNTRGPLYWIRRNLFGSATDTVLTLVSLYLIYQAVTGIYVWAIRDATFFGDTRFACEAGGACWALITTRYDQFIYGYFPVDGRWRVDLAFVLLCLALAPVLFDRTPHRGRLLVFTAFYPVVAFWLLVGGFLGLEAVETSQFGGLLLTLVIGVTGISFSLPIGILLALGRRSDMAGVSAICVFFIEFIRGVPLITLLFMASVMLPLFLPPGVNFDTLLRVLIMVTLFASAYMAEVIRGGLQAVPRGQIEAAQALGLTYWQNMRLIVLPQALKISIPGIVNTFIGLHKDTTLVLIIGLLDLLGVGRANLADANWMGLSTEVYVFVAPSVLRRLFRHVPLLDLPGEQAPYGPQAPGRSTMTATTETRAAAAGPDEPAVEMTGVHKWFVNFHVLKDINLTVYQGERIVSAGRPAPASRRFIRSINRPGGAPARRRIVVDGVELTDDRDGTSMHGPKRGGGMVFQSVQPIPAPHCDAEHAPWRPIKVRKMAQG